MENTENKLNLENNNNAVEIKQPEQIVLKKSQSKVKTLKREMIVVSIVVSLVMSLICSSLAFFIGMEVADRKNDSSNTSDKSSTEKKSTIKVDSTVEESSVIKVSEDSSKAVVSIVKTEYVPRAQSMFDQFFYGENYNPGLQEQKGYGSGFIVAKDGLIVTNKHVADNKTAEYTVFTSDGKEHKAKVLAIDPTNDLALLDIEGDDYKYLEFANSEDLKVGQTVVAIGYALGEFPNSVSKGVISGLNRDITISGTNGQNYETLNDIIQTDAAINPGNSGGPLLNLKGQVVGINTAKQGVADNIGFAIPSKEIVRALDSYKSAGDIVDNRGFLGITYQLVTKEIKAEYDLKEDYGAIIVRVSNTQPAIIVDSPADKAGLKINDVILEIDGKKIDKDNDLKDMVISKKVGEKINLKIFRDGKTLDKEVILGKR